MASHRLSLEFPDTSNEDIFKVFDQSVYTSLIPVVCPQLHITVPGFQYSVVITEPVLAANFNLTLTACDLELQTANCDSVMFSLPDGIYAISYKVSPHEYVHVDYNHLRITKAMNCLSELRCEMELSDCVLERERECKVSNLNKIEELLKMAKAKVEYCHEPTKGMAMYNKALKEIKKLGCKSCN